MGEAEAVVTIIVLAVGAIVCFGMGVKEMRRLRREIERLRDREAADD